MNAPRSSTLLLTTFLLWGIGCVSWISNFVVIPYPFKLDLSLRSIPVFMFGAAVSLFIGRVLGLIRSRLNTATLTVVAVVAVIVATVALCLCYELVFHVIAPHWGGPSWGNVLEQMPMMSWLFGSWVLLYFALVADAERRDREVRLAQATTTVIEAQHRLLVQQINPHFLFNALNTVYALVVEGDDTRAQRCLLALSAFFRGSLDRDAPRNVPLSTELASIRHYLEIELIRFGDHLRFDESVPPGLLDRNVPALILQPLVENCIKHGLSGHAEPMTIWLSASLEEDALVLSVEDDGHSSPQNDAPSSGVGLNNVKRRLQLLYGDAARLSTLPRPAGGFVARVHLPAS